MFFSVKQAIRIGGKAFRPCICYEVTPYLELTVKKLEEEGKVTIYPERVFFCNGKIVEKKPVVKENRTAEKAKKEKKEKKVDTPVFGNILEETADTVITEEDETEEF